MDPIVPPSTIAPLPPGAWTQKIDSFVTYQKAKTAGKEALKPICAKTLKITLLEKP